VLVSAAREAIQMSTERAPALSVKRTLARNTVWNYVGFGTNLGVNLLLFPFVVAHVGEDAAGIWLLLGSLTGYMGLLELGIVPALTQYTASALARNSTGEVNRAASTAFVLLIAAMGLALQLVWAAPALVNLLQIPEDLQDQARLVFVLAIAGFALKMPLAALQALLLGCQRQDRCNQLWIALGVTRALATVAILLSDLGIVALVAMEAATPLIVAGPLQLRWVRQELPDLRIAWSLTDTVLARGLLAFGFALLANTLCSLIIEQTDRFVIGAFLPVSQVTHYSAAWKLYMLAFMIPTTLVQAVAPMGGSLHGRSDREGLRTLLLRMTKYSAAIGLPLAIALGLCAGPLLRLWMGPAFVDARVVVLCLSISLGATIFNHAGFSVLIGIRRLAPVVWLYSAPQAMLNLVLSLWLVQPLGIVGVALGTTIPAVLFEYPFLRYLLGQLEVSWRQFISAVVWPTVVPALGAAVPLMLAYAIAGPESYALLAAAGVYGVGYVMLFWGMSLGTEERRGLLDLLKRPLRRVAPASAK
jgi:O-antigen/teichoic acid export membrane protein